MDIVVICIAIEGHDERASWATLLIEPEGFVEEKSGLASSLRRATLWALKETIPSIPSGSRIAIRTKHHALLQMKSELQRLQKKGSDLDPDADLLETFLYKLRSQEVAWVDSNRYPQPGDHKAQKVAKETLHDYERSLPSDEIDFLSKDASLEDPTNSVPKTEYEKEHAEEIVQEPATPEASAPLTEYEKDHSTQQTESESAQIDEKPSPVDEQVVAEPVSTDDPPSTQLPLLDTPLPPPIQKESPSEIPSPPKKKKSQAPREKGPKTLELPPSPDFLFGPRIVAYIDGLCAGGLGGWAFVLVDRQTGNALLRASGVRNASPYRIRLLSCIEVLSAIKTEDQSIEIRSRWQNIIKLGGQWMWNWEAKGWKKSGGKIIEELGFVQQLFSLSKKQRLQWQYVPDQSDDYGMILVKKLAKRALNDINDGSKILIDKRQRGFPVDRLL